MAIPDFAFGAMENLGCVTFREVLLLLDPQQATQPERVRAADVIAHEIAHMWFGDLVTMRWWNGIWLNEAFATFMGTMAVDAFDADWQRWVQFGLERSAAFDVDSLHHTRPIEYPVQSPSDADGMFDLLTYEKGGSVLRMLEQHLDETPFRDGIRHYLQKHQYGNTETNDLWDAIEEVTGEPARRVMDSWIYQRGFPLLSVAGDAAGKLTLEQRRFSFTPLSNGDDSVWSIPVTLRYGHAGQVTERRELLESASLEIDFGHPVDWVVANAGGHGFYRCDTRRTCCSNCGPSCCGISPPSNATPWWTTRGRPCCRRIPPQPISSLWRRACGTKTTSTCGPCCAAVWSNWGDCWMGRLKRITRRCCANCIPRRWIAWDGRRGTTTPRASWSCGG